MKAMDKPRQFVSHRPTKADNLSFRPPARLRRMTSPWHRPLLHHLLKTIAARATDGSDKRWTPEFDIFRTEVATQSLSTFSARRTKGQDPVEAMTIWFARFYDSMTPVALPEDKTVIIVDYARLRYTKSRLGQAIQNVNIKTRVEEFANAANQAVNPEDLEVLKTWTKSAPLTEIAHIVEAAVKHLLDETEVVLFTSPVPPLSESRDYGESRSGLLAEWGVEALTAMDIPPALANFLGRSDEIKEVQALIDGNSAVVITGMSGIGKTSLLLKVKEMRVEEGRIVPNGFFYFNCNSWNLKGADAGEIILKKL